MGVARVVAPAPVALLAGGAVGVARVVAGHGVAPAPLALLAGGVVGVARVVAPAPLALSDADARVDGAYRPIKIENIPSLSPLLTLTTLTIPVSSPQ